jgi:hypothetical protein
MKQVENAVKAGFVHHVEHIRSIERMQQMGLSIDGLRKTNVTQRKVRKNFGKCLGYAYDRLGLGKLNEIEIPSVILHEEDVHNLIPTEGLNYLLGAGLTGVSQLSTWYIAIFEGNYTPVAGVTAATFATAATESTAYDEANRQTWTPGAISAGSITNSASKAVFTINATKTIYGLGQLSVNTKGGTTGVLVSAARFASSRAVVDNDILQVTSTITMTSA